MIQSLSIRPPYFDTPVTGPCRKQSSPGTGIEATNCIDLLGMCPNATDELNFLLDHGPDLDLSRPVTGVENRQVIVGLDRCDVLVEGVYRVFQVAN